MTQYFPGIPVNDERDEGKEELNDFQPARDTSKHVPEARHGNFVRKTTITRIYCAVITLMKPLFVINYQGSHGLD